LDKDSSPQNRGSSPFIALICVEEKLGLKISTLKNSLNLPFALFFTFRFKFYKNLSFFFHLNFSTLTFLLLKYLTEKNSSDQNEGFIFSSTLPSGLARRWPLEQSGVAPLDDPKWKDGEGLRLSLTRGLGPRRWYRPKPTSALMISWRWFGVEPSATKKWKRHSKGI